VRILRHKAGLKLPQAFAETTQSTINHHTSQSEVWRKKGSRADDDILYSPLGEKSGTWAIKQPGSSNPQDHRQPAHYARAIRRVAGRG
jgi:hypothetical protein